MMRDAGQHVELSSECPVAVPNILLNYTGNCWEVSTAPQFVMSGPRPDNPDSSLPPKQAILSAGRYLVGSNWETCLCSWSTGEVSLSSQSLRQQVRVVKVSIYTRVLVVIGSSSSSVYRLLLVSNYDGWPGCRAAQDMLYLHVPPAHEDTYLRTGRNMVVQRQPEYMTLERCARL